MGNVDPNDGILEFAISKEIESYHFYLALARRVETAKMRDVFEELAAEELGHKARLELEIIKTGRVIPAQEEFHAGPDSDYIVDEDNALLDMDYKDMEPRINKCFIYLSDLRQIQSRPIERSHRRSYSTPRISRLRSD